MNEDYVELPIEVISANNAARRELTSVHMEDWSNYGCSMKYRDTRVNKVYDTRTVVMLPKELIRELAREVIQEEAKRKAKRRTTKPESTKAERAPLE